MNKIKLSSNQQDDKTIEITEQEMAQACKQVGCSFDLRELCRCQTDKILICGALYSHFYAESL